MNPYIPCRAAFLLALAACSTAPNIGDPGAKTVATGAAGGANAQNVNAQLEHCDRSLGTLTFVEEANQPWLAQFNQEYHFQSTIPLLRLIAQQSNCFVIVERGRAMANMQGERALMASGELRRGSNLGMGQMVAADYTATPSVTISAAGTGGIGAAVGGLLGSVGSLIGGSIRSNEASTMLLLTDNRSGIQLAAAEGSAKNWDVGALAGFFGGSAGGIGGGYARTPQGKVLVAAFMDSYNQLVRAVKNYQAQSVAGGLGTGGVLKTN